MKSVEIYYHDLTLEAQAQIVEAFGTSEQDENWDVVPLAIIDREEEESVQNLQRVEDWKKFSVQMEEYIREKTVGKYSMGQGSDFDLMSIAEPEIAIFNILKYALRIHNGMMKPDDLFKIAHYSQLAWALSGGKIIGDEKVPA